jgi:hypothetical protein
MKGQCLAAMQKQVFRFREANRLFTEQRNLLFRAYFSSLLSIEAGLISSGFSPSSPSKIALSVP